MSSKSKTSRENYQTRLETKIMPHLRGHSVRLKKTHFVPRDEIGNAVTNASVFMSTSSPMLGRVVSTRVALDQMKS